MIRHLPDIELNARALKCTVAFSKQHQHFVFAPTVDGDIRLLVSIEIRDGNAMWMRPAFNREWCAGRERELFLAVTEQHRHRFDSMVWNRHVRIPVTVKVRGADVVGLWASREWRPAGRCEAAFPIAEIDGKVRTLAVRHKKIKVRIFIYIGDADDIRMRAHGEMNCAKLGWRSRHRSAPLARRSAQKRSNKQGQFVHGSLYFTPLAEMSVIFEPQESRSSESETCRKQRMFIENARPSQFFRNEKYRGFRSMRR